MAKNITLMGASYSDVPSVVLPQTGGGTAEFFDGCTVTYSLTGGSFANVTPDKVVTGEGLSLRLSVPAGYTLSNVSVTMGGVDITSQAFAYDEDSGGGGGTAAISVVDTTDSHGGTVRTITALNISDTTAVASDVAQGKYFYTANGTKTAGTASGGTPSATSHTIYFEFSDSTNTTITAYWDGSFISDAITATSPETYGTKTVSLAQLDGVTWYERSAETWETIYDGRKTPNSDSPYNYLWFDSLSSVYPTVGSTWKVTIDDTSYRCDAYQMNVSGAGNVVCFGNPKYSGGTDDGSSIPANFYNAGWGALVGDTELAAVEHAIKIERLVTS